MFSLTGLFPVAVRRVSVSASQAPRGLLPYARRRYGLGGCQPGA